MPLLSLVAKLLNNSNILIFVLQMEAPAKEEKVEDVIVKTNEGNIKSKVSRNFKLT